MTLDALYRAYRRAGLAGASEIPPASGLDHFYMALLAFAEGAILEAAAYGRAATRIEPGDLVLAAAASYLERVARAGKQGVYVSGEAFGAFIRGGSNVALYTATSAALRAAYAGQESLRLLEIGVGDGEALLPALTPAIAHVDLVEPSAALLQQTTAALAERGISHSSFVGTVQSFAALAPPARRWNIGQATYSLHSLPPQERRRVLRWLGTASERALIVEFDAPEDRGDPLDPNYVRDVTARYQVGLAEYPGDELVAQGFLMPVFFGYFDPTAARTTYEQPIAAWREDLLAAGYAEVKATRLYPYWWADAYLLDAR
jgi:hypothetical protein